MAVSRSAAWLGILLPGILAAQPVDELFPRPFAVAVNQVGYMDGSSLGEDGGPWRAGIRRSFDVRDYRPFAEVGEAVGVRFMTLFALAEMDRLNVTATLPHATREGLAYDNSPRVSKAQLEIMAFVKTNAATIELGLTGVGHEWWVDGRRTRSEWYDLENKRPRDPAMLRRHMEVMKRILWQYGISEENGHRFPRSMSALGYHWNPAGPESNGKLFGGYGVRFVTTKFYIIPELKPPAPRDAGFDHGVLVMDREGYGNEWYAYEALPTAPIDSFAVDLIESHWANWLATDDFRQPALNRRWIAFLQAVQAHPGRYLAKNTDQLISQWLYRKHTKVEIEAPGRVRIDNRAMPRQAYDSGLVGNLVLAVPLPEGEHLSSASINGEPIPAYLEQAGHVFLYLPPLDTELYRVEWTLGAGARHTGVFHDGTYTVKTLRTDDAGIHIDLEMFGTQTVRFVNPDGRRAVTGSPGLRIHDQHIDADTGELHITLSGHDIQGQSGILTLTHP